MVDQPESTALDGYMNPSDLDDPFLELGDTGLKRYSGFINEEWFRQAKGMQGIRLMVEMRDNHPVVGAILFAISMLARQVTWSIAAGSEEQADIDIADFIEGCLSDMDNTWQTTLSSFLTAIPFGWSLHEIVYKVRQGPDEEDPQKRSMFTDKKIGIRKIAIRSQDTLSRWEMDPSGAVMGMWQQPAIGGPLRYIPIERAMHLRAGAYKDNPEGRSALRNAIIPYLFQKKMSEIEAIGVERDLAGLPVIRAPGKIMKKDANPNDKAMFASLKQIVQNLRRDSQEGLILPSDCDDKGNKLYELILLSSAGSRQMDVDKVIQRYDQRIAMTVLADFITLGNSGGTARSGSFGMAAQKTDTFGSAMSAWLDDIAEEFSRSVIPQLMKLNNLKSKNMPKLTHGEIEGPDLQELGTYVTALSGAGMPLFPDANLERHFRDVAGLPDATPDDGSDYADPDMRVDPVRGKAVIDPKAAIAAAGAAAAKPAPGAKPGAVVEPPPPRSTPAVATGKPQNMPAGIPRKPTIRKKL